MPKKLTEEYFASLLNLVGRFTHGALLRQIIESIDDPPPRRTLQDHLSRLVRQQRLSITGKGVARRYHLPAPQEAEALQVQEPDRRIDAIPLSPEAMAVKQKVSSPLSRRPPVGYDRAFLDRYRPNETFYLSADQREVLNALGSVSAQVLPAGTYLREIYNRILIDLSWNSSRLEGNTYSLLETQRLFELGESTEGKGAEEAQMILNHKAAIELLCEQASDLRFDRYTILSLHALLSDNLLLDPQACGRVRSKGVGITGTVFHPLEVPQMLQECFDLILNKASHIRDPFEQAFFVMVHLPYLQPFEDVNKRVSRLAANIPFVRWNLCPLSFVDVPLEDYTQGILGVYELNAVEYLRDVFVWAYKRSCGRYSAVRQSLGDPDPFRLKYRTLIKTIVHDVVRSCMSKMQAVTAIKSAIPETLPTHDQRKLLEVIETELSSLHAGNIARYRLRPSEYEAWMETWQ